MTQKEALEALDRIDRGHSTKADMDIIRQYIEGQGMPNVAEIANVVLRAAGTDFKHYMPSTQVRIIDGLQKYFLPPSGEE